MTASHKRYVSFIIPAMNEASMIVGALDSIRRLQPSETLEVAEVIVVDSGSVDATPELAQAAGCCVISASPGNVSASRNLGAAAAVGDVLAFVDADCELPDNWLLLCGEQLNDPQTVAVGMQMAEPRSNAPWVERIWHELAHRSHPRLGAEDAVWLATFNLAVTTNAFLKAGGFDESLTTCEDVDLGYRLTQHGRLRFLRNQGVIHHGESRTLTEFFRRESWRARGNWQLLKQHRTSLREIVSSLLPWGVIGSLLVGAVGMVWSGLAPVIGALPLLFLVVRRRPPLAQWPLALVLQTVYCAARCAGMLRPVERVERATATANTLGRQRQSETSIDRDAPRLAETR